jgi:hypothetical protein
MAELGYREEIPDDDPRLRLGNTIKKIAELLNKVTFLKEDYGDRPLMAPPGWEPARTQGLGTALDVDKLGENVDLTARGFSPFTAQPAGTGSRIPELQSRRKDAMAVITDLLPGPGPTEAKAAGAVVGQIRKKGDSVSATTAKKIAEELMEDAKKTSSKLARDQRTPPVTFPDDQVSAFTEVMGDYLRNTAGSGGDPLTKMKLVAHPRNDYETFSDLLEPWRGVRERTGHGGGRYRGAVNVSDQDTALKDFRTGDPERAALPLPPAKSFGAAFEDVITRALLEGKKQGTELLNAGEATKVLNDPANKAVAEALLIAQGKERDQLRRIQRDAQYRLEAAHGKFTPDTQLTPEVLADNLSRIPEGSAMAVVPEEMPQSAQYNTLREVLGSKAFAQEFLGGFEPDKIRQMAFPDIFKEFSKKVDSDNVEFMRRAVGEPIKEVRGPNDYPMVWEKLGNKEALRYQGLNQNICVGMDDPYCKAVAAGTKVIYGLKSRVKNAKGEIVDTSPAVTFHFEVSKPPIDTGMGKSSAERLQETGAAINMAEIAGRRQEFVDDINRYARARDGLDWGDDSDFSLAFERAVGKDQADKDSGLEDIRYLFDSVRRNAARGKANAKELLSKWFGMDFNAPQLETWTIDQIMGYNNQRPGYYKKIIEDFLDSPEFKATIPPNVTIEDWRGANYWKQVENQYKKLEKGADELFGFERAEDLMKYPQEEIKSKIGGWDYDETMLLPVKGTQTTKDPLPKTFQEAGIDPKPYIGAQDGINPTLYGIKHGNEFLFRGDQGVPMRAPVTPEGLGLANPMPVEGFGPEQMDALTRALMRAERKGPDIATDFPLPRKPGERAPATVRQPGDVIVMSRVDVDDLPILPGFDVDGNDAAFVELPGDAGFVYYVRDEGNFLMRVPVGPNGEYMFDHEERARDFVNQNTLQRIREHLGAD